MTFRLQGAGDDNKGKGTFSLNKTFDGALWEAVDRAIREDWTPLPLAQQHDVWEDTDGHDRLLGSDSHSTSPTIREVFVWSILANGTLRIGKPRFVFEIFAQVRPGYLDSPRCMEVEIDKYRIGV